MGFIKDDGPSGHRHHRGLLLLIMERNEHTFIIITQHASLTPEQEMRRAEMQQQVADVDLQIQAKTDEKRKLDKDIDGLLALKREYVFHSCVCYAMHVSHN